MSALFKVGNTDLTNFITVPSYIVNSKDIYEEYTDGNKKFRRKVIRTRISGSFSLLFSDKADFKAFLTLMKNSKTKEGAITATVYVNNLMEVKSSTFFIEYDVADIAPFLGTKRVDAIQVTIEEQ